MVAPGHVAWTTMVLMAKGGSSSRPSPAYAIAPAAKQTSIRNQTSERWASAQSERLKSFTAKSLLPPAGVPSDAAGAGSSNRAAWQGA